MAHKARMHEDLGHSHHSLESKEEAASSASMLAMPVLQLKQQT